MKAGNQDEDLGISLFKWRGKGRMWFWGSELGGRDRWQFRIRREPIGERSRCRQGPGMSRQEFLPPSLLENKKAEVKLPRGGRNWAGEKKDPDRHPGISKSTPRELAGRGQESYKQLSWPPRDRKRPPSWCVKQNKGTKVPHWLTFWGAHRMASFSYPTPAPMRSWNILYPLEKKCKSESQAFVSMTTGGTYFGKSEFIYIQINISVYDSGTFLHEIFQNHIECCSHAKNLRIKMRANFRVCQAPRFGVGFISRNEKEW